VVTTFGLLFRPSSDCAPFQIKEKPYNPLDIKWEESSFPLHTDADKSLARPGRKQTTATEDFDVRISYLYS